MNITDLQSKKEIASLVSHTDSVSSVAMSHDAKLIASGSKDKTIKLWQRGLVIGDNFT
jgi:WD40 repeat protein